MTVSEKLFIDLCTSNASKKKLRTLQNIKTACDKLSAKYNSLSPATVSSYCENKWGTPKEQSIRNNTNYVRYIKIREDEREKIEQKRTSEVEILVVDQVAQAIINELKTEIKHLKASIKNIKKGIRQIAPIDVDKFIADNIKVKNEYKDLLASDTNEFSHLSNTVQLEEKLLTEIVKSLNDNLLEKYFDSSIDYQNGVIFNNKTGVKYWESKPKRDNK